jgi:CheY-like chemotaxis protein
MQLVTEIVHYLPMLRRYARAVTGDQAAGDDCVALMLERLSQENGRNCDANIKVALYRELAECLLDLGGEPLPRSGPAQYVLQLSLRSRQAMLLTSLEGLSPQEATEVLGLTPDEFAAELDSARQMLGALLATDVLIIEDEFFVARDLANIVRGLGHQVTGRARTHAEARAAVASHRPGLILADVHLADGSSGIEAVSEIVGSLEVPVIFITAYPERLLTGLRPEPTFLISKPYRVEEVKAVICQSLFFDEKARAHTARADQLAEVE